MGSAKNVGGLASGAKSGVYDTFPYKSFICRVKDDSNYNIKQDLRSKVFSLGQILDKPKERDEKYWV